jgi:phosphoribosyl 1,2-cyclic phosphodiesterase
VFSLSQLMSLFIASLNSGSNGNCYYIGNADEAVLVDIGISCREVESRLRQLELDVKKIKAVFISHEHTDHIRGLELFSKKHDVPVYITDATRRHGRLKLQKHLSRTFSSVTPTTIGRLSITAFNKFHDAADPYSFTISFDTVQIGVFTDIGRPCSNLIHHFKQCHAAFLESNYDEVMLQNGKYPYHLKKRITGGLGHLSNDEALELFRKHRSPQLTHLFLSHLSQNNNCPRLVQQLFDAHADGVKMIVASRHEASPVYHISPDGKESKKPLPGRLIPLQLQLDLI